MGNRGLTLLVAAALAGAGCSADKDFKTQDVTRSDYGARWPLTVERAILVCDIGGAPTFQVDGRAWGPKSSESPATAPKDLLEVWADDPDGPPGHKMDLGVLLDDADNLCA